MKKTFQKTLIAAAAGVALMSAAGTASANSLLFPYFTTTTGAQSVLSLSAFANSVALGGGPSATTPIGVHYVYNYGTACTHFDANGSMTPNDILSHSIAATTVGGFGKVVSTDTSTPVYFPLANQSGFLVVSSTTGAGPSTAALRGSMAIVDPATGLVVSYAGIDNALDTSNVGGTEGNFSGITDLNFVLTSLPAAMVTTSWYGVSVGDMSARIAAGLDWKGNYSMSNGGFIWNNDEVPLSGATTKSITCAGSFTSADLMTTAQAAAVGTNGSRVNVTGTATVPTASNGFNTSTGAILMKMQAVTAAVGAPFAGKQFLHREQVGGL